MIDDLQVLDSYFCGVSYIFLLLLFYFYLMSAYELRNRSETLWLFTAPFDEFSYFVVLVGIRYHLNALYRNKPILGFIFSWF